MWAEPWSLNDLDRRDRTGWLYAPSSGSTVATSPVGGTLRAHTHRGTTTLTMTGAPAETQVLVATSGTPRRVLIDGRPVAQPTMVAPPFGGLVLKLNPRAGASTVTITW